MIKKRENKTEKYIYQVNQIKIMNVNLGNANAAVGVAFDVITEYLQELTRIGKLPDRVELDKDYMGQPYHVIITLNPYEFAMVRIGQDSPRSILKITGNIEARPVSDPSANPIILPLEAAVRLSVILKPGDPVQAVGFRYDGVDGTPSFPVSAEDIDGFMSDPAVLQVIDNTNIPIADNLVSGLSATLFKDETTRPSDSEWSVVLTLTPRSSDSIDAFVVSVAPPGLVATLAVTESFMAPLMGISVAYNRTFLDPLIEAGASAKEGEEIEGAKVESLSMVMADTGIMIDGHVIKEITILPDVDIYFDGIAIPQLVRGTTAMTMDTSGIHVDVDDSDEIFYGALKWILTIGASALLFTGVGALTILGISLWATLVQTVWKKSVDFENAPNVLRDSLGDSLGAQLSILADSLNDSTDAGDLVVDQTPDSAKVVNGHIILYAQVIISQMMAKLRSAEYSHKFRRFVIYELNNGRKFRAQELARLMKAGKIIVPGFHHVNGSYIRSDHDDSAANNLLKMFKSNETREVVVKNK
jgi:hypothetical protein